jgi:enoyl-CoA hydratase/carnithine racemase
VIEWDIEDEVGVLRLARPPMNALNLELLQALEAALGEAER